jgi:hypothetical protein
LLIFFLLAAALCLAQGGARAKAVGLALSVVLPLIIYHASQALFFARFLLPCTPFIALVAAWGVVAVRESSQVPWARRPIVLWVGVAIVVASPLSRSIYLDAILHRPDTRFLAKDYLEQIAPAGSAIVREVNIYYIPPIVSRHLRLLTLHTDPSLLDLTAGTADYYLFSSFITGRVPGISGAQERDLMAALERRGFSRITFSPLRGGGDLPFELDQIYLPYRGIFRFERPGPTIAIYARPGSPLPVPAHSRLLDRPPNDLVVVGSPGVARL